MSGRRRRPARHRRPGDPRRHAGSSSRSTARRPRGRAASAPPPRATLGYRFCDTGLLYRALTEVALRDGVDLSDAAALLPLVDRVELAPDRRRSAVTRPHRRRRRDGRGAPSGGGPGRQRGVTRARGPSGVAGPSTGAGRGRRDRDGRPGHRDRRPARRRSEGLPRRLGRGAGPSARRGARPRRVLAGGGGHPGRPAPARRSRPEPAGGPAPAGVDAVHIATDGNTFEQTVAAVVAAIRSAEAGP